MYRGSLGVYLEEREEIEDKDYFHELIRTCCAFFYLGDTNSQSLYTVLVFEVFAVLRERRGLFVTRFLEHCFSVLFIFFGMVAFSMDLKDEYGGRMEGKGDVCKYVVDSEEGKLVGWWNGLGEMILD
jgi:hypothetical protein